MTLPIHGFHRSRGARFEIVEDLERLVDYGDAEGEYGAMNEACVLADLSDRGRVAVLGEDRVRFLNSQASNDVQALDEGRGLEAALLTRQSKVQALVWIFNLGDRFLLDVEPGFREQVLERLSKYRIADRVTFSPVPEESCLLSLQGPGAPAAAARVLGPAAADLPPGRCAEVVWTGGRVGLFAFSRTGRAGLELATDASTAPSLWEALEGAGARPAGWRALETGRIESGLPRYGADVTAEHLLAEAGAPQTVSYSKGCYVGQEVVARVKSRGHVNRRRTGVLAEGPVARGDRVVGGGQVLGAIGSAAWSPGLGRWIATAVLREPWASQPGAVLEVAGPASPVRAVVAALPLISPEKGLLRT